MCFTQNHGSLEEEAYRGLELLALFFMFSVAPFTTLVAV
jgi:hypothetical protein